MAFWSRLFGAGTSAPAPPRAAIQSPGAGVLISTAAELDAYLRSGNATSSGIAITPDSAMRAATVYACVRLISGAVATLPLNIKRRVDDRVREDASDTPLWELMRRRPNRFQLPAQFRRMLQAHVLLYGNAYALIVRSRDRVLELIPLDPARMDVRRERDLSPVFHYRRRDGGEERFGQAEVLHLYGLTLDGIKGVSPLTYAREAIGLSLAMEDHGSATFKNGARVAGILTHPNAIGPAGVENLRKSIDEYRAGGIKEGRALVLEEGVTYTQEAMTSVDAQWIESRKFSRGDIAMFYGVPPHMIGDTEKGTSWGTGLEQQSEGFKAYALEDHLTMWEEAITALAGDGDLYARFNRAALVRSDMKTRWEAYVKALQWGVNSPNEIRALEDQNPREGGDVWYDPPNTAGQSGGAAAAEGSNDEPAPSA